MEKYFNLCNWYHNYKGEILSLVEQAILADSKYFLYWPSSSWSSRISSLRKKLGGEITDEDDSVFNVFRNSAAMRNRAVSRMFPRGNLVDVLKKCV